MKSFSKLYSKTSMRLPALAALVGALSVSPSIASAQIDLGGSLGKQLSDALSKAISQQMEEMMARKVNVSPAIAEVAPGSKSVTIELENPTDDTLTVNVVMSSVVPPIMRQPAGAPMTAADSAKAKAPAKKTSILSDDDDEEAKPADDGTYMPMGSWIKGLPKQFVILPKAKAKVVVDIEIPVDIAPGEYVTWIAAEVEPRKTPAKPKEDKNVETGLSGGGSIQIKMQGGGIGGVGGPTIISSAKIHYKLLLSNPGKILNVHIQA